MAKVIVYTQPDGTLAVAGIGWMTPPAVQDIDGALAAAPAGAVVLEEAELPDRRASDAWVLSGGQVTVDLDKVRARRSALARGDGMAALEAHDRYVRLGLYGAGAEAAKAAADAEAMVKQKMQERLARIAAAESLEALLDA
jgi:hypothetical protein